MSDPPAFDPHRFRVAAAHYRRGRTPSPPLLIRRVAEAVGLRETHRVLDLGCGPGQLAIGFAFFAGEVVGLDPEPEMLAAAQQGAEGLVPNAAFRQGSSYQISGRKRENSGWSRWAAASTGWTAPTRCGGSTR